MQPGRPLSEGNRLQRAYHRWALPHYQAMAPELRLQVEAVDRFLYSARGVWVCLGLLAVIGGTTLGGMKAGLPWWLALMLGLVLGLVLPFALLSVILVPHRFTLGRMRQQAGLIVALMVAGTVGGYTVGYWARRGTLEPNALARALWGAADTLVPIVLVVALAWLGLFWGAGHIRRQALERGLRQARLEQERDNAAREAAEARLRLLQVQIQPHFVFNTLSAVQHWVDVGDPRGAPLLRDLTGFLRGATEALASERVPLAQEAELARCYLAIMQARLGERLQWSLHTAPAVQALLLPPGLLLTLVENAVEHGISPLLAGGRIEVLADVHGGQVQLTVRDSGGQLRADALDGVGLANTRERLRRCFGTEARLTVALDDQGCSVASLSWPLAASALPLPLPLPTSASAPSPPSQPPPSPPSPWTPPATPLATPPTTQPTTPPPPCPPLP